MALGATVRGVEALRALAARPARPALGGDGEGADQLAELDVGVLFGAAQQLGGRVELAGSAPAQPGACGAPQHAARLEDPRQADKPANAR